MRCFSIRLKIFLIRHVSLLASYWWNKIPTIRTEVRMTSPWQSSRQNSLRSFDLPFVTFYLFLNLSLIFPPFSRPQLQLRQACWLNTSLFFSQCSNLSAFRVFFKVPTSDPSIVWFLCSSESKWKHNYIGGSVVIYVFVFYAQAPTLQPSATPTGSTAEPVPQPDTDEPTLISTTANPTKETNPPTDQPTVTVTNPKPTLRPTPNPSTVS